MNEPIAVIGSACRFPGGSDTPSKFWDLLKDPQNVSKKVPTDRFDVDTFYHPEATHHGTTNAPNAYFLEDDISRFDNGFFNIQPMEADAIDPQQRFLMEVVYDSLTSAGIPMEKLQGSDTAIYIGQMCDDWSTMMLRDWETMPTYAATGMARSIVSNRISYFFDWHGPSMTIDTACSSSLVAVHQAVQSLRSGESKVAVAAGTNLIFVPCMFISESKLRMLSPHGRSAMWDVDADGYARGEGVAAVLLKTLKQAIADGDPIQCIIRETSVNQDGRTSGLTMPSNVAQATLIREAYERAGLDINKPSDRPQFFHAHGTGTQAGDPQEAEAISTSLFPNGDVDGNKLFVGSVKTVIGHTEGTAGVASLIATSLAMRNGIIPPNLHFNQLSPKVAPFYKHLQIPVAPQPWPEVAAGQVRRASVNSFGFGGTNSHAILETYNPPSDLKTAASEGSLFTPLTFSAATEKSLRAVLAQHLDYLQKRQDVNLHDLAWTLQERRSTLPFRKTISGSNLAEIIRQLDAEVNGEKQEDLGTRYSNLQRQPKILGIFTGQGAQWPRMGAQLIECSPFAEKRIADFDHALQSLPAQSRPTWTIKDQLLAGKETSRMAEAALSQPLCTAVQILLVDIMRAADIRFEAVVGHSSGEIGAAYAAGLLSVRDAIRIAYFRGIHAKKASSPNGGKGAMMAIGTSHEEAVEFCEGEQFRGRIQVAAVNSASSVTLSGDEDAIDEAVLVFKEQSRFARKLRVDTAYHSAHMLPCAKPYLESLRECPTDETEAAGPVWFSSVNEGARMTKEDVTDKYWVDNMCSAVRFSGALYNAVTECGPFDLTIELGPHPALKGPATANIEELGSPVPYTGVLSRGKNDLEEIASALGFAWTRFGSGHINFAAVEKLLTGDNSPRAVVVDLPSYPFDHQKSFWLQSRVANHYKYRDVNPHPILGTICLESRTSRELQWRNILRPNEISWLNGHKLQGQIVFPATGYVSLAVEALKVLAAKSQVSCFRVEDLSIGRAIAFDDESSGIETLFNVSSIVMSEDAITAEFACYSVTDDETGGSLNAKGRAIAQLAVPEADTLPMVASDPFNLADVDVANFYAKLGKFGYGYTSPFQGVTSIKRKPGFSTGLITDQSGSAWEDQLVVHPGMLDTVLQSAFAAWSSPGDGELWSLHVPTHFSSITINPYFSTLGIGKQMTLKFELFVRDMRPSNLIADIHVYNEEGTSAFVQIEGGSLIPFSPASAVNDTPLFSSFHYKVSEPNGQLATWGEGLTDYEIKMYTEVERVAFFYVKQAAEAFPVGVTRENVLQHFKYYLRWCDKMVDEVTQGIHPNVKPEHLNDTKEDIERIMDGYRDRNDVRFLQHVGEHVVEVIQGGLSMLEFMNQGDLMRSFYSDGLSCGPLNRWLGRIVGQISHRYPQINILEIGAGTGATTIEILNSVGSAFSTYTFTDISAGFFLEAEDYFKEQSNRMIYKIFDMDKLPSEQGFTEGQYDVVVAANVLHVSGQLEKSMANVRRLLKPGGYILILEIMYAPHVMIPGMTVGTLPGWWSNAETGRPWCPGLTTDQWNEVLYNTGFSGIDTMTPHDYDNFPMTVLLSQAVDDRTTLLRNPLQSTDMGSLSIVGGTTQQVSNLGDRIKSLVSGTFANIFTFKTLEDFAASEQAVEVEQGPRMNVLVLTDLDEPYMKNLTPEKFSSMQTLWNIAGTLVWVSKGSRADEPYSYMLIGIGRIVVREHPNLNMQLFDVDSINEDTARTVADTIVRHHLLHSWSAEQNNMLWSAEPEIFIQEGNPYVPRLLPNHAKNDRLNSLRRTIRREIKPATEALRLISEAGSLELHEISPLRVQPPPPTASRTIRISHSVLQSLAVGDAGFLRLCTGVDIVTGEIILALSPSSESPAVVPADYCVVLNETPSPSDLLSVGAFLIAEQILRFTSNGNAVIVNEPDDLVKEAISTKASERGIKVIFTTSQLRKGSGWVVLHPKFSQHHLKVLLPKNPSLFIQFSRRSVSDTAQDMVAKCLPPQCARMHELSIFGSQVQPVLESNDNRVSNLLSIASEASQAISIESRPMIPLGDVYQHSAIGEPLAILDWTAESVSVMVQSIDADIIFRSDRTYFFAGMSGELGQALCQWMIEHGARYLVLTSRTPKISARFVSEMAKLGATVQAIPLDVTNKESIHNCFEQVHNTMPAIAGVLNGAMVLDDGLFANMTHEQFNKVVRTKVEGTKNLDEVFYDTPLDFFICASSITSIVGQAGQSNYSAANTFMVSTMNQRRKRGVAGSAMDIAAVVGIGYAAQGNNFDFDFFESCGYFNMSEHAFELQFAEAIISGRPDSSENLEVVVGVNYVPPNFQVKDTYLRDIKFSHFVLSEGSGTSASGSAAKVLLRTQLQSVKSREEAYEVTREYFIIKLKKILQMGEEETLQETSPLVEQGVDSLVAVDVRTWFVRELEVEIPVLKVLGGSSIEDLLNSALDMTPTTILDLSGGEKSTEPKKKEAVPAPKARPPLLSRKITTDAGSSSNSSGSPVFTPSPDDALSTPATGTPPLASADGGKFPFPAISAFNSTDLTNTELVEQMSFGQARFWFLHQFLKDKTPFNSSSSIRLTGPLDVAAFEHTVNYITRRHEALHTRHFWSEGDTGIPMQGIPSQPRLVLEKKNILSEKEAKDCLTALQNHVYDLENLGGVRMQLLTLSDTEHFFLIGSHHIALDGQSIIILIREIALSSIGQPIEPLLEHSQYRAFSAFQREELESGRMNPDIDYFRESIPSDTGAIELFPFSKVPHRSAVEQYRLHRAATNLSASSAMKVKQLARRLGCTSFHVYLSILQAMIFRILPDTDDFFVGIADSNRVNSRFTDTVGCLVNLLPIKFSRSESTKLSEAIKATRNKVYGAIEHSKVPFDVLLDELKIARSVEHSPTFQVYMDYRQGDQSKAPIQGCESDITWLMTENGYDLVLEVIDTNAESLVVMKVQDSLYEQKHAEFLLRTYVNVVEQFLRSPTGDVLLSSPSLWSKQDIEHTFEISRGPRMELEWAPTLSHRVDEMVDAHPEELALRDGHGNSLTYSSMGDRVNSIAKTMTDQGISVGSVVAVFQEPGSDWMCSMLAILRLGATYVPLDRKNGIERLVGSVSVAYPGAIIFDKWTEDTINSLEANSAIAINVSNIETLVGCDRAPNQAKPELNAAILFTSGSTGKPKGIPLPHSCLSANAEGVERAWKVGSNIVLQQITLSFDFSLHQIFTALANGGTLVIVPSEKRGKPADITKIMLDEGVTHTLATPTEYSMWFQAGYEDLVQCISWQWALSGGEALLKSTVRDFSSLGRAGPKLYDFYGPIEATIAITKGEVAYRNSATLKPGKAIPTGHILPNYSVYILDEKLNPLPIGIPGEIVVGGPAVAAGYLGLEDLTAEKFIENPFLAQDKYAISQGWNRLYRTGDRGRVNDQSQLFYEGRIDGETQVKILGVRTELGEIESAIMTTSRGAINQVIVAQHGEASDKFLVAYVVMANPNEDAEARDKFLEYIRAALPLPQFMRPSIFLPVNRIPINSHGKTDRKALKSSVPIPSRSVITPDGSGFGTEMEKRLANLWASILPPLVNQQLDSNSDFFRSGGNSMLLVKLQRVIKLELNAAPRIIDIMNASVLREMARVVESTAIANTPGIDWKTETAVPETWASITDDSPNKEVKRKHLTIVMTGATGYIGSHLLPCLSEDPNIAKIICLVRDASHVPVNDKITTVECDLDASDLGLTPASFAELAENADVVVHLAANRAFWDSYEVLRHVNVNATKELARMALHRRVPLHFFSSGAARKYTATQPPPVDGSDAYLSSKWAAETLLRETSRRFGLPLTVHTPIGLPANTPPSTDASIMDAFLSSTKLVGLRPSFDSFSGYIDIFDTEPFVKEICRVIVEGQEIGVVECTKEYNATARFDVDTARKAVASNETWAAMRSMDMLAWTGEAKKHGLPFVLASQDITIQKENSTLFSRR